ncbi:protein AMN1 homolog isoform X1 [Gadus macrocephalus]|uniref:protein AMN1 homolog isoform X1 n=1 Tax=Gadus macrocephalus TaxID=80720 RepID=UPI0028CBB244|nr:protein AMN1 homolog isoform X1 [Gadus macrocephalus]
MAVNSLLNICADCVANSAVFYLREIHSLPSGIKDKLVQIMSSRGTISDGNISELLHPGLQTLDLQCCQVSDLALGRICCPRLKTIFLNNSPGITSEGVLSLASSCPDLQNVDLGDCVGVADEAVQALARHCKHLEVLSLSGCPAVGDVGLQALAENCSLLHTLLLSGTRITDAGIIGLLKGLCRNNLCELQVARCPVLTDETVRAVFKNCPKLKCFVFNDCPHITGKCSSTSLPAKPKFHHSMPIVMLIDETKETFETGFFHILFL